MSGRVPYSEMLFVYKENRMYTEETAAYFASLQEELVQLIEAGKSDTAETDELLKDLLGPYIGKLDALVLGCTHYPFAAKAISRVLAGQTVLLEGGDALFVGNAEGFVRLNLAMPRSIIETGMNRMADAIAKHNKK